jgi:hypothetical protein
MLDGLQHDAAILVAIARFSEIVETQGEDAAIAWADDYCASLTESERKDTAPRLRIVS